MDMVFFFRADSTATGDPELVTQAGERASDVVEQAEENLEDADVEELKAISERLERALEAYRGVLQGS